MWAISRHGLNERNSAVFKLGWFVNGFMPKSWYGPWAGQMMTEWTAPSFWVDMARSLERGRFDLFFLEDTSMIDNTYGGSAETTLKYALMAPKNDPMPLVPMLAAGTRHIGLLPTISTMQYHPYLAARLGTTLDHLTEGRAGFNIVTSVTHTVAQNFGYEKMFAHDERYAMAEEWMDAVSALWESWEPGALVLDDDKPMFADHTKVHPVNFAGKYFRTKGPLNTVPGPQRRPVIAQAGSSPAGRDLAARNADVMLGSAASAEEIIEFRRDMDRRLISFGRKPEDLHIFFLTDIFIGRDDEEARDLHERVTRERQEPELIERRLWAMSYSSGGDIDYAQFDLDQPMPQAIGNGERTVIKGIVDKAGTKTLREVVMNRNDLEFVGSPTTIADQMNEVISATGRPDGYLIAGIDDALTRHSIIEITDGLCPALMKKKYIRSGYGSGTFRDNLNDWG
jgi:FMN-dependent oxidoreductase (nitrilotriacetate monooxygenase family)